jgi:hypothetical protein
MHTHQKTLRNFRIVNKSDVAPVLSEHVKIGHVRYGNDLVTKSLLNTSVRKLSLSEHPNMQQYQSNFIVFLRLICGEEGLVLSHDGYLLVANSGNVCSENRQIKLSSVWFRKGVKFSTAPR